MDAFEENLQTFNGTIYGHEMRDALYRCFELIRIEINNYTNKLRDAESKINELEGG